jgi:hypothetical protein
MKNFKKSEKLDECKRLIDKRLSKPIRKTKTPLECSLELAVVSALALAAKCNLKQYYALRGDEYLARLKAECEYLLAAA